MTTENISKRLKMCNDIKPGTSFSSLNIIANIWQSIEPFLSLQDTISSSKCCKTLHGLIIDSVTKKVKVSHYIKENNQYARYLPWALNTIYFPSLKQLRYPPCYTNSHHIRVEAEVIDLCFSAFVVNLSMATNLESLTLNARQLTQLEYDGKQIKWILKVFGTNLLNCSKLKELIIPEQFILQDRNTNMLTTRFSVDLMQALTPTIIKRKNELERLDLVFEGLPINGENESRHSDKVAKEFYTAVFQQRKLASIYIGSSVSVTNILCTVARECINENTTFGLDLQDLKLQISNSNPTDAGELLALFSNTCPSLETIDLRLPRLFWTERGCVKVFSKVIFYKTKLKRLVCDFESYSDHDDRILQHFNDFISSRNSSCFIESFRITDLHDVSPSQMRRLGELLYIAGLEDSEFECFDMNGGDDDDEIFSFEDDDVPILISYFDAQIPNMKVTYPYR